VGKESKMPNRFYVYDYNLSEVTKYESIKDFVLWLNNSADCECQSYATSMKNLRKLVPDQDGVKI
jgi:hypothetical protein